MYCYSHCFLYSRTECIMKYGAVRKFYHIFKQETSHLYAWAKLQNTRSFWSASLTCVGRLWRSRHNTIDVILNQWHVNEWPGILKLLPRCVYFFPVFPVPNFFRISWVTRHHIKMSIPPKSKYIHDFEKIKLNNYKTKKKEKEKKTHFIIFQNDSYADGSKACRKARNIQAKAPNWKLDYCYFPPCWYLSQSAWGP